MKKHAGIWISLGAAAVLTLGLTFTALAAAEGWVSEDGQWKYKDSSGNYVTNTWKTSGGEYFYLNSSGVMATKSWIDDTYYVNERGARGQNSWIHLTETVDGKEAGWYFVNSSGKLVTDKWETINNMRYSFDEEGKMRTGWYFEDDDIYYLGGEDQGYAKTGWKCLAWDEDNEPEEGDISDSYSSASEDIKWFYFKENGKAEKSDSGEYESATINGNKYYFDENGVMMSGWVAVNEEEDGDSTGISKFVYLGDENSGTMAKSKWLELDEHPGDSDDSDEINTDDNDEAPEEGESQWYYFESDGTPAYLSSKATSMSGATTKVDGSSYFFNQYGCMQTGLLKITTSDGKGLVGYFGDSDSNGKMYTGKRSGVHVDGDTYTYYFTESGSNKGAGYSGEKNDYLYYEGRQLEADSGSDYQVYEVDGKLYLLNESGKVQTSSKCYKVDGDYTYEISGGKLYWINDDKERQGEVTSSDAENIYEVEYEKEYDLG